MKIKTQLNKIMQLENSNLKLSKLSTLSLKCFSNSPIQKEIIKEYDKLLSLGYKEVLE
jgi:hypothetical protein